MQERGDGMEEDERGLVGGGGARGGDGRGFGKGIRVKQEWGVDEGR